MREINKNLNRYWRNPVGPSFKPAYLDDISSRCSRCALHTGLGVCRVHGWRRELLLLVHAWVGDLGAVRALDHGLRGPGGHRLGMRVSAQRSHDGRRDGSRRGVVLSNLLNDGKYILFKTGNFLIFTSLDESYRFTWCAQSSPTD